MAPRRSLGRRRLLSWQGSLRLRCGCLRLWGGCLRWCRRPFLLSRGGQRLFCSRWRCRDRRRERLYRRWGDLWRRIRRDLPQGGWRDPCGVHRLVRHWISPLRSEPGRHRELRTTDHARGGAYQGGDHCILSMYAPPRHSHHLRRAPAMSMRSCAHTAVATCRPQPPRFLPRSVDSIRGRTGDTEEMGIPPCAPTSPASQTLWLAPR
jgi:hypothetical protein